MSELVQPKDALIVPDGSARFTDYGRELLRGIGPADGIVDAARFALGLNGVGMSDDYEVATLEHLSNKNPLSSVTGYLALCTVVPTDPSTGTSITEANYTGYARLKVEGGSWASAVSGSPSSQANGSVLTFPACTAGTSTIIAWAYCTAATLGKVIVYGTATSTVISTTQTPATVAVGLLAMTAD